ncbi:uncharacterized protein LOC117170508 [Belonocnema kinseyi]|uniref:uncharacterized protein LOC117170508 n=1 Tax=Belonocnema kinseyi TaxID=2817044 RepID=UPI00143D6DF2|nr:uncharacterized protein LOC117170508 [Belonocnema kinseyi]
MELPTKKKCSEPAPELTEAVDKDKVFLIYKGQSFEESRSRLSKYSLFFNNLFTGDYSDSTSENLEIKHQEANLDTFKVFLTCLNSEQPFAVGFVVNDSLKKYEGDNFEELQQLFRLALYFLADDLLSCLSYIIVTNWFNPMHILDIWLMAEGLACEDLQKAAFAMCLDIFESIPKDLLFALPMINFQMIITNPNLRSSEAHLKEIVNEWAQKNNLTEVTQEDMISKFKNAEINNKARYLQCVTGFVTIPESGEETIVFVWDGTINKLEVLSKISDGIKAFALAGSQILGRGYSVYVVGGEKSIGKGSFSKVVTRYCLLTKTWYKVASLPVPRRHMVAAFLDNKLVLVGGVGLHRIKLSSVQVLDIYTGIWTNGPDVPQEFTENPPTCVIGDQLLVAMSGIYSYKLESNKWDIFWQDKNTIINNMVCCNKKLYVTVRKPLESMAVQIYLMEQNESSRGLVLLSSVIVGSVYNFLSIDNRLVWFFMSSCDKLDVEVDEIESTSYNQLQRKSVQIKEKMRLKSHIGCFNVLNPKDLMPQLDAVCSI